ncbi:MAG: ATP-grasp domain-containing protein [Candidatus Lokiarchaeota archaeon]|nr:ATP-grasp domain-containing protein [Candidatus Lokiarchaeota archaeon]
MFHQKIFIFEFVSGGGFNQVDIPSSLFCEGYAMLRTIIEDFKNLGFHVTTLLDSRIKFLSHYMKADVIKSVELVEDYLQKYTTCVRNSDFCFVIAPEFSNVLYNLTKVVKENKKKLLSIDLNGVKLGASKLETYKFFIANEINTPKSYNIPFNGRILDLDFILQKFDQLNSSIVIKPDDGVGSELIFYFEKKDEILHFFESSNKITNTNRKYILQEYIEGDPMSVSIINDHRPLEKPVENGPKILSINAQNLQITDPTMDSVYLGGFTPVDQFEQLKAQIENILKGVDLSAFKGYFGIDFVKKVDNSLSFIEINPRLTTSYVGIRNVLEFNPMDLLLTQKKKLQNYKLIPHKFSEFTQIKLKYDGKYTLGEINNLVLPKLINLIPEIITPPIIIEGVNKSQEAFYSCFIATKSNDNQSSKHRISQINQIFSKFDFRITK